MEDVVVEIVDVDVAEAAVVVVTKTKKSGYLSPN
jgi:hypothetical protein